MSLIDIDPNLREIIEESKQIDGPLPKAIESLIIESGYLGCLRLGEISSPGSRFFLGAMQDLSAIAQLNIVKQFRRLNWKEIRPYGLLIDLSEISCRYGGELGNKTSGRELGLFAAVRKKLFDDYDVSRKISLNVMDRLFINGIKDCELCTRSIVPQNEHNRYRLQTYTDCLPSTSTTRMTSKRIPRI